MLKSFLKKVLTYNKKCFNIVSVARQVLKFEKKDDEKMKKNVVRKIMKEAHKLTKEIMELRKVVVDSCTCSYAQQLGLSLKQLYKEYKEELEYKKEIQEAKKVVEEQGLHMEYTDLEKCINKSLEIPELFKEIKKEVKKLLEEIGTKYVEKVYEGMLYVKKYIRTKSEEIYSRSKRFPSLEYKYDIKHALGKLEDTYSNLKLTIYKHCSDSEYYADELDRLKKYGYKDLMKNKK